MKSTIIRCGTPYKKASTIDPKWWLVDASDKILGRLASSIAMILMGKHKPTYTPHCDAGDAVVVIHAEKVKASGTKNLKKEYTYFTGHPGGFVVKNLNKMMEVNPVTVVKLAVRRMLPKNKLGRDMLRKLWVYEGTEHPHGAQQPVPWDNLWIKKRMERKVSK
jgi:large subunit ribosomal protein L13